MDLNRSDSTEQLLYEQMASRFVSLIEKGTLQVGERLPSVRRMAAREGVSISTVVHAYRALEDEGWLEARPQSGYYVRRRPALPKHPVQPLPPEPEVSCPECEPAPVSMADVSMLVARHLRDPHMIQLGMAVCDPNIHPTRQLNRMLQDVARTCGDSANSYNFSPGSPAARAAIAGRLLQAGCDVGPDDLVLTLGCLEALNLCLRAVCEPGDTVVLESPTYFSALQAIEMLGLRALEVPTHPRDGIVLEALEDVLEREPVKACLLMPCFSNPLGSRMPDENKRRLVEMLRERQIPLIEDDIWADTSFDEMRPKAAKAYDQDGWVMLCSSFSKTLGPGYRVGWCAPGRWRRKVEHLKLVTNNGNPPLTELAIAEFLRRGGYDHHLRRVRKLFAEGIECGLRAVGCYFPDGTRVTRPRGGHMLWVELPPQVDGLELFEAALKFNISLAPGQIFSSRHSFHRFIRLNCAYHPPDIIDKALQTVGQLVSERM